MLPPACLDLPQNLVKEFKLMFTKALSLVMFLEEIHGQTSINYLPTALQLYVSVFVGMSLAMFVTKGQMRIAEHLQPNT